MTADQEQPLAHLTLEELHRLCATVGASYREAHGFTVRSYEHSQKVVVWLGGLMGAGIFSVQGLLSSAPPLMRLTVLLPWAAGIVCAMLTGLLTGELALRNDLLHFARISLLDVLQLQTDRGIVLKDYTETFQRDALEKNPANIALNRWRVAALVAFYLAHVFFVVGVVAAVTTMMVLGK